MYADLRVEIVELFEEAQGFGAPRKARRALLSADEQKAFQSAYARVHKPRIRASQKAWRKRSNSELRERRAAYVIVPIAPETRVCPSCGAVEELRPGTGRWMHMGTTGGRCETVAAGVR